MYFCPLPYAYLPGRVIAHALALSNLSPTWTTRPDLSDGCLQDSPVCSGQLLDRIGDRSRVSSLKIEL
jgi:hypothetical protein